MTRSQLRLLMRERLSLVVLLVFLLIPWIQTRGDAASPTAHSCPPGGEHREVAGVRSLQDGGKAYVYDIEGVQNTFYVPPAGFEPEQASNEQLEQYGFPRRPADAAKVPAWREQVRWWNETPVPDVCTVDLSRPFEIGDSQSDPAVVAAAITSRNWAGYVAKPASGNRWVAVQGDYQQPAGGPDGCTDPWEVSWVGLGGYNSGSLIQAGTWIHNGYTAWYEYLKPTAQNPAITTNLSVRAGDQIHLYVDWAASNTSAGFVIENRTLGTSSVATVNLDSGYYDGSTADYIDERPKVNGTLQKLRNFGQVNWTNTRSQSFEGGNWVGLGNASSHDKITMTTTDGTVLAAPNALSTSTSFTDVWKKCG